MGNEKALSDEILKDAERRAKRIRSRADREAKKIRDQAVEAAEAAAQKVRDAAQRRAERTAQSVLATLEQEARRDLLEAQETELNRLFETARQRLADRSSYDYPAVLAALAVEAIAAIGSESVVIEFNDADRAIASDAWLGDVRRRIGHDVSITVPAEAPPIDGGLVVRSADGRLLYDNSFAARLERLRPALRQQIARRVYPRGDDEAAQNLQP